jgi:hypothetical protein
MRRHSAPSIGDAELVEALADLMLSSSHRAFSLPAAGTPSILFRFGGSNGVTLGARATDPAGVPFAPGTEHRSVQLVFWAEEAREVVAVGSEFDLWYGGDIGTGQITAIT